MNKNEMIYEGKAKRVYTTDEPDVFIQEFKDDATAGDGAKRGTIADKGIVNNKISSVCFEMLESNGVHTHFIKMLSDRDMAVRKLTIMPLEVVCRNIAAGSLAKRLGIAEGEILPFPVVEFYLKDDALHDPLVNQDHIKIATSVTEGEVKILRTLALEINELLKKFFEDKNVLLVDFKLEFGRDSEKQIRLGDEISPDTCRLWDKATHEKLDKDRFRRDMGGIEDAYQEMLRRVTAK